MRGKACKKANVPREWRITPAYAGKRMRCFTLTAVMKDHPRVCGEKGVVQSLTALPEGSPPRMRGKAENSHTGLSGHRITPAYAGKS